MKLHVKNEKTFTKRQPKRESQKNKKEGSAGEKKDENWIQFSRITFLYIYSSLRRKTHTRSAAKNNKRNGETTGVRIH
jgi:hypothetical protein